MQEQNILAKPVKVVTSEPPSISEYLKLLFKYKSLILVFAQQEIKATYAQTYLGLLWGVIRPLITIAIFTVIFSLFLNVPTEQPYYIFAFSGLIAWNFFAQLVNIASISITQKKDLIQKMYFPKLILPLSTVLVSGVDFLISLLILLLLILLEGGMMSWTILTLPLFILLNIFCAFFIAIWMIVLNVRFRDLNQIVPAIISIAIWVTPVFYPTTIIPERFNFFIYSNPMSSILKGYRYALFGSEFPEWQYWPVLFIVILGTFLGIVKLIGKEDEIVDYA